jgi:hypothetical protein
LGVDRGLPVLTIELPPGPLKGFRDAAAAALETALAACENSIAQVPDGGGSGILA